MNAKKFDLIKSFKILILISTLGLPSLGLTCAAPLSLQSLTYCVSTTAYCQLGTARDPLYNPQIIRQFTFNYSKTDPAPISTCSGSTNGTVSCHGGTTSFSASVLPASPGACQFSPNTALPSAVTCDYRTSTCQTYCDLTNTITYCG